MLKLSNTEFTGVFLERKLEDLSKVKNKRKEGEKSGCN